FVDTVYDEVKEDMQRRGITTVLSKKEAREGLLIQQISSGYAQALTIELEKMKVVPTNNLNILLAQRKKAEKILTEELPKITAEGGTGEALTAIQRQLEIIEKDTNLQHSVIELQLQKMPAARNEREAISNQAQALLNAIDSGIKINRQSIATAMDTYEIAGTIFNETLWQWHWETNELGEAILADVLKETQRAETQIYQYINALNDEANELSSKSPELIKLREVIRFYLNTSLDMLIAVHLKHTQDDAVGSEESIKPEERMTHSMRWIVLEGAVTRVLNAPVQELDKKGIPAKEIGSYRQLLREIGRRIIRSAEFELPALAPGEKVTVKWDYVPRPDEFRVILDRISRDLVNIIAPGGLTSHVVFTAAANGVGVLSVPEGIKVPISEHQQIVVSRDEHGDTYIDLLAPEEVPTDIPVDLLSKEMLAKAFSFMSDRDVLSNADSEQEVGQFARGGVGLGRAENIRAFFPTRQVFTKNKIAVIKKIHHEGVAEFRVIDLQEDKLLLILSHLKNVGEKFYLTHPLGIELFKEDLRSSLDLVRWQRALPNNDPNKGKRLRCKLPMIENMDDINQAKAIIDQVLEEEGFEDFNRGIPPELGFSIMIETPAAFENLDKFLQIDWIEAFSWGTNDYTAKKKKVKRNDPSAAAVFTDVHPSIIMDIRHGTRKILDAKGDVSICGALADRQRFWILRAIERHFFANVPNVSMPGNDVPSYNGVNVVMRQLIDEKHPDVTAIVGLLERMNDEPQGTDLDQKYSTKLNEALQKLSLRVDDRLRETVRARLELPANDESMNGPHKDTIQSPSTQNKDTAMLTADPARTPENTDGYGGVDFTQYRDSMTVSQNSQTATVPLPDGKTITIGGPDFAGFTFNIIQIVPYTVGM
ncbi:MAG TPA: putative PEP-binding protein, partial [Candidatus Bathyarchaeia archaeon]|nr:putative PEP-binding protein [Candidatus Bathyarchaeia archaeon]